MPEDLEKQVAAILAGKTPRGTVPELWDGQTASRVVNSIKYFFHIPDTPQIDSAQK